MDQLDRIEQRIAQIEEKVERLNTDQGFELHNGIYIPKEKKDDTNFWEIPRMAVRQKEVDAMFQSQVQGNPTPPIEVKYKIGKKQRDISRTIQPKRLKRIHGEGS